MSRPSLSPFKIWGDIFNRTDGRIFTVIYRKKDGSIRKLNGRIYEDIDLSEDQSHLIVTDMQAEADSRGGKFRKVDPKHIIGFKCGECSIGTYELDQDGRS